VSTGGKPDPETDKIITIHYQKIDFRSGKPLQDIVILKEWESSEEEIVTRFYDKFFRGGHNKWIFIPVGYNLNSTWEFITCKFEEYLGRYYVNRRFHFTIPHIDLESIIVLLNKGNFIGAKLEKFTKKPSSGNMVKKWYKNQEYDNIENHIKGSAEAFLIFFTKIKENIHNVLRDKPPVVKSPLPAKLKEETAPVPPPTRPSPKEEPAPEKKEITVESEIPEKATIKEPTQEAPVIGRDEEKAETEPGVPEKESPTVSKEVTPDMKPAEIKEIPVEEPPAPARLMEETVEIEEEPEIHEEVHEIPEIHVDEETAEFAPEAIEVATEEGEAEAYEVTGEEIEVHEGEVVEAVEAHEIEVEEVVEEHPLPQTLSPKELKKKLKEEAKLKKKEKKGRSRKKK